MRLSFFRRGQHAAKRRHWLRVPFALGAVIALVLGLGAGAAYGYFLGGGSGSGAASTGADPPVTVVAASGTVTDTLSPGNSGDLLVELDNPNNFPVEIVSVTGAGAVTAFGRHRDLHRHRGHRTHADGVVRHGRSRRQHGRPDPRRGDHGRDVG